MRRPSAFLSKQDEETSDSLSTMAPNSSSNHYLDDSVSPFLQDNSNESDSETLSDSSKKIKKKRSTYQKIPDDIRISLLDCVKNGETLKAAAKRFKINYSSAKSILHTYRKEGRILKKPAQERTTKKKALAALDNETPTKAPKQVTKKDKVKETETIAKPLAPLSERANSQSLDNKRPTESPRNKEIVGGENMYQKNHVEETYKSYDYYQQPSQTQYDHYQTNQMNFPNEFFSFQDMHTPQQRKPSTFGEDTFHDTNSFMYSKDFTASYLDEDKFFRADNDAHFGTANEGYDNCPLRSFMDTQKLLQEAFRKTSFSYNGENNGGYRKGSADFFF